MILGKITGKLSTQEFKFHITGKAKKFDYVQVMHGDGQYVLGQIIEIENDHGRSEAFCNVIGFRTKAGTLRPLRVPLEPDTEVLFAEDDFIKETLGLESKPNTAYIGTLEGRDNLKVYLDLNKLLTKHMIILAKSGAGKSFLAGDIIEDLLDNKIPVVIIDPHGEYSTIRYPNPNDSERMAKFEVKPKGYLHHVQEYTPDTKTNPEAKALKLSCRGLTASEVMHLLPAKLTNSQKGTLYSALKNTGNRVDFNELILDLEASEETSTKWTLINILEYVKSLNLFSDNPTLPGELVVGNKISIINLKGIAPEVQEVVVYKIVSDLFTERKKGNIPPFFLLVEEAHNFAPERSFGETKASAVLRQIASEGRKFGLGLGIVSQRASRVEKSVISQASTQFILKVTNPNDLKAISSSVEGITHETEKEIRNIPVGTALVTGIVDVPLFVNIRPRRSKHGGEAVKIFNDEDDKEYEEEAEEDKSKPDTDFVKERKRFEEAKGEMVLVIPPKLSKKDIELMSEEPVKVKTVLVPCVIVSCNQGEDDFNILIDLNSGEILTDIESRKGVSLKGMQLEDISPQQSKVFQMALKLKGFKPAELFAMSGVQFSELYDLVTILTKKGYFLKDGDTYSLNEKFVPLSNLSKFACYEKPDFHRMETDSQLPRKFDLSKIKEFISKFTEIRDIRECFLAIHEISPRN